MLTRWLMVLVAASLGLSVCACADVGGTGQGAGGGGGSSKDLAKVPGVVIDHSPASSRVFIGSPSIAIMGDGKLVASHDVFGPGSDNRSTRIFVSQNRGKNWASAATLEGQYWSTLFVQGGALYILGTSREYGDVVIRRSTDGGKTWTTPKDRATGLLKPGKHHCAPVPVVQHAGKIWRAIEDASGAGGWPRQFRAMMMSAPADSDLLNATSWTFADPLSGNTKWLGGEFNGWLEGNAVVTPAGRVVDFLRVDSAPGTGEMAAIVSVSDDGKRLSFDAEKGFVPFPGGAKKFTIRFDDKSKLYWSLANYVPADWADDNVAAGSVRNTLALVSSPDLRDWNVRCVILHHSDREKHAFQYADWQFEGEDMIAVVRTAYNEGMGEANSYHDSNYLTFHRIAQFRTLNSMDSVPMTRPAPVTFENEDLIVVGRGFEIATLKSEGKAFSNRDYVWDAVPPEYAGLKYTRTAGGVTARITVQAKRSCVLQAITAAGKPGTIFAGWESVSGAAFSYTDRERTKVFVYRRRLAPGEALVIPQNNWSGMMVLLPGE